MLAGFVAVAGSLVGLAWFSARSDRGRALETKPEDGLQAPLVLAPAQGGLELEDGKRVFYVTNTGIFRLTKDGLMLIEVMPGINIQRDIIELSGAKILLPPDGQVPLVATPILTGTDFVLQWPISTGEQQV